MGGIVAAAQLRPPARLTSDHNLSNFRSQEPALDQWLVKHALRNEGRGSRTYVACCGDEVIGFYALANGAIQLNAATPKARKNSPNPVPVMVLGRLAVSIEWEGKGIGSGLLRDAVLRTLSAGEIAGITALLVHALSDKAKAFYERHGFTSSIVEPMTLMITLKEAAAHL